MTWEMLRQGGGGANFRGLLKYDTQGLTKIVIDHLFALSGRFLRRCGPLGAFCFAGINLSPYAVQGSTFLTLWIEDKSGITLRAIDQTCSPGSDFSNLTALLKEGLCLLL